MTVLQRMTPTHWRILAVIVIAVVWAASLWPSIDFRPLRFAHADKLEHFVSYAVIAYLLCRGWPRAAWPWMWAVAVTCGGAAEIGQALLTTTRHPDWWDMLANAVGALSGVGIERLTSKYVLRAPSSH